MRAVMSDLLQILAGNEWTEMSAVMSDLLEILTGNEWTEISAVMSDLLQILAGNAWTEMSAATKLEEYRAAQEHYMGQSFQAISAYGSNGAVVHYRPSPHTDKRIGKDSLYLLDSGAQYKG